MNPSQPTRHSRPPEFWMAILEQAPYGILVCDSNGEIEFANQLAGFLLQKIPLTGRNLQTLLGREKEIKLIWQKMHKDKRFSTAMPYKTTSTMDELTEESHLSLKFKRLNRDEDFLVLVFIEDLSVNETLDFADRHYTDSLEHLVDEKNRELDLVQKQLIQSEKRSAMIETAGAIAHELRQPMTAIIGITDLLGNDQRLGGDPKLFKRIKTINRQCLRMAEIIAKMGRLVEYKTRPYVEGRVIIDFDNASRSESADAKRDLQEDK